MEMGRYSISTGSTSQLSLSIILDPTRSKLDLFYRCNSSSLYLIWNSDYYFITSIYWRFYRARSIYWEGRKLDRNFIIKDYLKTHIQYKKGYTDKQI